MWQAIHRIDTNGHAVIDVMDDAAQNSWAFRKIELTSHEAERLIKSLRKAIDAADKHNRQKYAGTWP